MNLNEYLKNYINKLNESSLLEKSNNEASAINTLVNSNLFNKDEAKQIINKLRTTKLSAFFFAKDPNTQKYLNWPDKYLKGIARMIVEESSGDTEKAESFLNDCIELFSIYLQNLLKERQKIESTSGQLAMDNEFNNNLHFDYIKQQAHQIKSKQNAESDKQLADFKASDKNYQIIPIESYQQLHKLFGGSATGDGSSDGFAGDGRGGTAWCHTNSELTYNAWVKKGKNKFFILARNDWKDLKFNQATADSQFGKDAYGTSLIAILVDTWTKNLLKVTLRGNHSGRLKGPTDNQYETYAELSELTGLNVKKEILDKLGYTNMDPGTGIYWLIYCEALDAFIGLDRGTDIMYQLEEMIQNEYDPTYILYYKDIFDEKLEFEPEDVVNYIGCSIGLKSSEEAKNYLNNFISAVIKYYAELYDIFDDYGNDLDKLTDINNYELIKVWVVDDNVKILEVKKN